MAFMLTKVRDWNAWLLSCGMTLQGHTGPSAPHMFTFLRRADAQGGSADLVEHPDCLAGAAPSPHDVVLFVKRWMASPNYSQAPFVALRAAGLQDLSREPPVANELRPMTQKYKQHVLKFVPLLKGPPYDLRLAADHLEAWVQGTLPDMPMHDVSACTLPLQVAAAHPAAPMAHAVAPLPANAGIGAQDFEPPAGTVLLTRNRNPGNPGVRVDTAFPDDRSNIVYSCAVALFQGNGVALPDAIAFGEQCWARIASNLGGARAPPAAQPLVAAEADEAAEEALDLGLPA